MKNLNLLLLSSLEIDMKTGFRMLFLYLFYKNRLHFPFLIHIPFSQSLEEYFVREKNLEPTIFFNLWDVIKTEFKLQNAIYIFISYGDTTSWNEGLANFMYTSFQNWNRHKNSILASECNFFIHLIEKDQLHLSFSVNIPHSDFFK